MHVWLQLKLWDSNHVAGWGSDKRVWLKHKDLKIAAGRRRSYLWIHWSPDRIWLLSKIHAKSLQQISFCRLIIRKGVNLTVSILLICPSQTSQLSIHKSYYQLEHTGICIHASLKGALKRLKQIEVEIDFTAQKFCIANNFGSSYKLQMTETGDINTSTKCNLN